MKLICVFVFTYAKGLFSHDAAHLYSANFSNIIDKNHIKTTQETFSIEKI